ncbi:unnamed protein product [Rotaria magnacalcarata]|uniref:Mono(ADP-ribosyl)transferase n=1 Tax=Rotaria magnacalcarata TaxID=392030 RepID=A0A817A5L6_9BILA|nr:unnamed protein product [Rotaria magnacalcarata]CAF2244302.1 unnamed protein product [Rotaria magnacalcarata]CAF4095488.1 unnamed protein product [Rotaria magnacalcarata]CAF4475524.1 unnamed protein product [Rotaria magnacalcarata]
MVSSSNDQPLYEVLNSTLRSVKLEISDQLKLWFLYLKLFIDALTHLPSYREIVYRSVTNDLSDYYELSEKFVWWSFSSCTKSLTTLQSTKFLGNTEIGTLFIIECFSGKEIHQNIFCFR